MHSARRGGISRGTPPTSGQEASTNALFIVCFQRTRIIIQQKKVGDNHSRVCVLRRATDAPCRLHLPRGSLLKKKVVTSKWPRRSFSRSIITRPPLFILRSANYRRATHTHIILFYRQPQRSSNPEHQHVERYATKCIFTNNYVANNLPEHDIQEHSMLRPSVRYSGFTYTRSYVRHTYDSTMARNTVEQSCRPTCLQGSSVHHTLTVPRTAIKLQSTTNIPLRKQRRRRWTVRSENENCRVSTNFVYGVPGSF